MAHSSPRIYPCYTTRQWLGKRIGGEVEEVVAQSLEYSISSFIHKYGKQFMDAVEGDRHE